MSITLTAMTDADAHNRAAEPDFDLVDEAERRGLSRYAAYHAVCWAAGETDDALRAEIARKSDTRHNYAWNEVGSAHLDHSRAETLKLVLAVRSAAADSARARILCA